MGTWGHGDTGTWDVRNLKTWGEGFFSFFFGLKYRKILNIIDCKSFLAKVRLHKEENDLGFSAIYCSLRSVNGCTKSHIII